MNYRILLLSAYDAMSHKMWRGRLVGMFPEHSWTQLTLPPRNFNWRIRGNSLQWALNEKEQLSKPYDLLIATSMVDLASLRGFLPDLARIPTLLYFHENQFAYPAGDKQRGSNIEPQLVPLYSALCANAIIFNSAYNRTTFLDGAGALLDKLPDRLSPKLMEKLEHSEVIPVPLQEFSESSRQPSPAEQNTAQLLEVVWNHRWEYDKGPQLLLELVEAIVERQAPIRLHVVGQQFKSSPQEFCDIGLQLSRHAKALSIDRGCYGFIEDREDYIDLLRRSDVVLSTARHDFQGLAIQEACALGCTPLVPDALVYPEYIDSEFRYASGQPQSETILSRLQTWQDLKLRNLSLPKITLDDYSEESLRPRYAALMRRLVAGMET